MTWTEQAIAIITTAIEIIKSPIFYIPALSITIASITIGIIKKHNIP